MLQPGLKIHWSRRSASCCFNRVWRVTKHSAKHQSMLSPWVGNFYLLILPSLSFCLSFCLSPLLLILDRTDVCSPLLRLFPTQFRAKMDFSRKKRKEKLLLCSHRHTTVIAGPTCLIAHLLAPHDRAFSPIAQTRKHRTPAAAIDL